MAKLVETQVLERVVVCDGGCARGTRKTGWREKGRERWMDGGECSLSLERWKGDMEHAPGLGTYLVAHKYKGGTSGWLHSLHAARILGITVPRSTGLRYLAAEIPPIYLCPNTV